MGIVIKAQDQCDPFGFILQLQKQETQNFKLTLSLSLSLISLSIIEESEVGGLREPSIYIKQRDRGIFLSKFCKFEYIRILFIDLPNHEKMYIYFLNKDIFFNCRPSSLTNQTHGKGFTSSGSAIPLFEEIPNKLGGSIYNFIFLFAYFN